jgi:hypothetical protein
MSQDDRRQCIARSSTSRYCPAYTQRNLCFEDMYLPDSLDERDYRTLFIVRSCLGFNASFVPDGAESGNTLENPLGGNDPLEILDNLLGSVESMCNEAPTRSREILYMASEVCKDLIICENVAFRFNGTDAERDPDDNSEAFGRCGSYDEAVLQQQLMSCTSLLDNNEPPPSGYEFQAMCPIYLQDQFASFPPGYPNQGGNGKDRE